MNPTETTDPYRRVPDAALWSKSQKMAQESGHGGVPNMSFRGEAYFGQDRFDHLFSRLVQNGLTPRDKPIPPILPKPRRFPDYELEVQYAKEDLAKRASQWTHFSR